MHYSQHPVHRGIFATATNDKVYLYSVINFDNGNREEMTNNCIDNDTKRSKCYKYNKYNYNRNNTEDESDTDSSEQEYSHQQYESNEEGEGNTTATLRCLQPIREISPNCQSLRESSEFSEHKFTECTPINKLNLLPHTLSIFPSNTACIDNLLFFIADDHNNGWMGKWSNNLMSKLLLENNYNNNNNDVKKRSIKSREEQKEVHHDEEKEIHQQQQKQKRETVSLTSQIASTAISGTSESVEITCSSWCSEPNTPLLAIGKKNGVVQVYQVEPISNDTGYNKANYGVYHHHKHHLYNQYHHHRHNGLSHSSIMHSRTSKYTESNESDTSSSDSEKSNSSSDSDSRNNDNNKGKTQLTHLLLKSHNINTQEQISRKVRKSNTSHETKHRTRFMYKTCLIWQRQYDGPVKSILWLRHDRFVITCSALFLTNNQSKEIAKHTALFGDYVEINNIQQAPINKPATNNINNSSDGEDLNRNDSDDYNHSSFCLGAPLSLIKQKIKEVNTVSYSLYRNSATPITNIGSNNNSRSNRSISAHKGRSSDKKNNRKSKTTLHNSDASNANEELIPPHELFIKHRLFISYSKEESNDDVGDKSNAEMWNSNVYSLCFADVIAVHDSHDYLATSSCINLSEHIHEHLYNNTNRTAQNNNRGDLFMNIIQLWDLERPNCPVVQKFCTMPFADKYTSLQWVNSLPFKIHHDHHSNSSSSISSSSESSSYQSTNTTSSYLYNTEEDKYYSHHENEELLLLAVTESGKMHIHSFNKRSMSYMKAINKYFERQRSTLYEYQHFNDVNNNENVVNYKMQHTTKDNQGSHESQELSLQDYYTSERGDENIIYDWDVATRYLELPSLPSFSTAFYLPAAKYPATSDECYESNNFHGNGYNNNTAVMSENTEVSQLIFLIQNVNTVHALPFNIQPFAYKHIMTLLSRHNVILCGNQHTISLLNSERLLEYEQNGRNTCNSNETVAARRRACMLERAETHFGLNVQQNIKLLLTSHHANIWPDHEAACLFNYGRVMSHYFFPYLHGQCNPLLFRVPTMIEFIAREVQLRDAAACSTVALTDKAIIMATQDTSSQNTESGTKENAMHKINPIRHLLLKSMKWEVNIIAHDRAKGEQRAESVNNEYETDNNHDETNNTNNEMEHIIISQRSNKLGENVVHWELYNKEQIVWSHEHVQKLERRVCILVCQHYIQSAIDLLQQYRQVNELYVLFAMALQMHCKSCKESFVGQNIQAYEELLNNLINRCVQKENTHWMQLTLHIMRLQIYYYRYKTHDVGSENEEEEQLDDNKGENSNYSHGDEWLESLELPFLLRHYASWMNMADKIGLVVCLTLPEGYHTHHLNKLYNVLEAMTNEQYFVTTSSEKHCEVSDANTTNQSSESCTLTSNNNFIPIFQQSSATRQIECPSSSSSSISLLLAAAVEPRDEEIIEVGTCTNTTCTTNISALQQYVDETGEMQCPLMYELCYGNFASAQVQNWSRAYLRLLDDNALYLVRCAFELHRLEMWERRSESQYRYNNNYNNINAANTEYYENIVGSECNACRKKQLRVISSTNDMDLLQTRHTKEQLYQRNVNTRFTNANGTEETVQHNNNNQKKEKNCSKEAHDQNQTTTTSGRNVDSNYLRRCKVVSLLSKYNHSSTEPSLNQSTFSGFSNPCSPTSNGLHGMFPNYNSAPHSPYLRSNLNSNIISGSRNDNNMFTLGANVNLQPITSPISCYGGPRSMKYPLPISNMSTFDPVPLPLTMPHTNTINTSSITSCYSPPSFTPLSVDKLTQQDSLSAQITETCRALLEQYRKLPLELRCECRQAMHNSAPSIAALQSKRFPFQYNLPSSNRISTNSMLHHYHHQQHLQQQQIYQYDTHQPQHNTRPYQPSVMPRPSFSSILQQPCNNPECQSKNGPQCVICEERFKRKQIASGDALDYSFAWCTRCLHGGHYIHLVEWFAKHKKCAVEFCECECCLKEVNHICCR